MIHDGLAPAHDGSIKTPPSVIFANRELLGSEGVTTRSMPATPKLSLSRAVQDEQPRVMSQRPPDAWSQKHESLFLIVFAAYCS